MPRIWPDDYIPRMPELSNVQIACDWNTDSRAVAVSNTPLSRLLQDAYTSMEPLYIRHGNVEISVYLTQMRLDVPLGKGVRLVAHGKEAEQRVKPT